MTDQSNPLQLIEAVYKKYVSQTIEGEISEPMRDLWAAVAAAHAILFPLGDRGEWHTINVTSGYGGNTRRPFIEVHAKQLATPLHLDPEAARDLAWHG